MLRSKGFPMGPQCRPYLLKRDLKYGLCWCYIHVATGAEGALLVWAVQERRRFRHQCLGVASLGDCPKPKSVPDFVCPASFLLRACYANSSAS